MGLEAVLAILEHNYHCTIGCASHDGEPWVSPVFFNYDNALRIVFESEHNSYHAQLIAENPRVAVVIADDTVRGSPTGVYLQANAREVPEADLTTALDLFLHGPHKKHTHRSADDYWGDKPLRLYEVVPSKIFLLSQVTTADGYEIDRRVELQLPRG